MRHLDQAQLREVGVTATEAGLSEPTRRTLLFRGFPVGIMPSLPAHSRPYDQLISDLEELNQIDFLEGLGKTPLVQWLSNAIDLAADSVLRKRFAFFIDVLESRITSFGARSVMELRTRAEVYRETIALLKKRPSLFYATIAGPYFLHPKWYIERRDLKVQMPNFDVALGEFIDDSCRERNHNVKLIFTFSPRYESKATGYVAEKERPQFKEDILRATDLIWGEAGDRGPDLCCIHPGFAHIQMIFDSTAIILSRRSQALPVTEAILCNDPEVVQRERRIFEQIFEANSVGQLSEIGRLRSSIKTLWLGPVARTVV